MKLEKTTTKVLHFHPIGKGITQLMHMCIASLLSMLNPATASNFHYRENVVGLSIKQLLTKYQMMQK